MAVPLGSAIRWLGLFLGPTSSGGCCWPRRYSAWPSRALRSRSPRATGKGSSEVLFSGQSALGPFISKSASYTVGALLLLIACKGLAYGMSLSGFRGGPTFPAMFLGAVGGVALSHLPGLPLVDGIAMGIGAMTVVMLRLPLTSVLLATLLLARTALPSCRWRSWRSWWPTWHRRGWRRPRSRHMKQRPPARRLRRLGQARRVRRVSRPPPAYFCGAAGSLPVVAPRSSAWRSFDVRTGFWRVRGGAALLTSPAGFLR